MTALGGREKLVTRLSDLVREPSKGNQTPDAARQSGGAGQCSGAIDAKGVGANGEAVGEWYAGAEQNLLHLLQAVRSQVPLPIDRLVQLAADIGVRMQRNDDLLVLVLAGRLGRPLVHNPINVAILAGKLALGLGYEPEGVQRVILAGLLHDIGMGVLPESLVEKTGPFSGQDRELLEQHPQAGFRLLAALGNRYEWLAMVVKQEHERWEGQGYPGRLRGAQIHEYAQIIGLSDTLDAMINPRPYRRQILPHFALRECMVKMKGAFSPHLLKTLVNQLSLYPLGTFVRLNTGEVGVVSLLNQRYPLRPHLTLTQLPGSDGQDMAKRVDLSQTSSMHIVEVLKPPDVG